MPKWSNFENTRQNSTKFSEMLGGGVKMITYLFKNVKQGLSKLKKGSGETDFIVQLERL